MIVAVFRSRVASHAVEEFTQRYAELSEHVVLIPGYLSHKVFVSSDDENCLIVEFATEEAFIAWDTHPEHNKAKERGKADVFSVYDVKVGRVFEHHHKP